MFDLYHVLLYLHVLAAIAWLGTSLVTALTALDAGRDSIEFLRITEPLSRVLYPVAAVTLLVTGVIMTVEAWSFSDTWIWLSVVLLVLAAAVGAGVLGRAQADIARAAESGWDADAMSSTVRRFLTVGRLDVVVIALVVALMVFKPLA